MNRSLIERVADDAHGRVGLSDVDDSVVENAKTLSDNHLSAGAVSLDGSEG